MSRFIEGQHRQQSTLLPDLMEDYITEENPVRLIDALVDRLKLFELGLTSAEPKATGRPAYHPTTMLKLYICDYLNKVQSSRRLECEANRNLELMWLLDRRALDFKTIADFRKDNDSAIKASYRQIMMICKQMNLFAESLIEIDGSRFKAVNNRERNFNRAKEKRRIEAINKSLDRYLGSVGKLRPLGARIRCQDLNLE
jgi:transposase